MKVFCTWIENSVLEYQLLHTLEGCSAPGTYETVQDTARISLCLHIRINQLFKINISLPLCLRSVMKVCGVPALGSGIEGTFVQ